MSFPDCSFSAAPPASVTVFVNTTFGVSIILLLKSTNSSGLAGSAADARKCSSNPRCALRPTNIRKFGRPH
jgi:hypothetical protein